MRATSRLSGLLGLFVGLAMPFQDVSSPFERLLFRDIPAEDLTRMTREDREAEIQTILDRRGTDHFADKAQCRSICVEAGTALGDLCERAIRDSAPLSRAVCHSRVDQDRTECLAPCDA